ncbi:YitT family protein [Lacticaseibacillus parakribbianus]|uniref:YitT family protein n=1 Tax=Lacticaseibacillus parakribbianus TaxID=2970927 RepID=UPI0021CAFE88|nr:YitT family protein [Lacticaseibacillus parakribbianus]
MQDIERLIRRHQNWSRFSAAIFYSICVAIALNMFWEPGGVFASGITGAAQLLATVVRKWFDLPVFGMRTTDLFSTGTLLFLLNVPLFVLAWRQIGHRFTLFTFLAVIFSTVSIRLLGVVKPLTTDPIVCGIFGAVVNGLGTGFALRNNISTGGLDIIGIVWRKKTGTTVGSVNIAVNIVIIFLAGFVNGWPHALYSALAIFINGKVMDALYTRQQRLQVMIVTEQQKAVVNEIQNTLRRGITIVHDAEGAFRHEEKTILFTIISRAEMYDLEKAMRKADPYAFVSITESVKIMGHFYEPKTD